jgi:sulfur-oxidizing protein SoxY
MKNEEGSMPYEDRKNAMSRRAVLGGIALSLTMLGLAPEARALTEPARKVIQDLVKGEPKAGRIVLKAPEIAENGNAVPVTIAVEGETTPQSYVKAIHLIAEENPNPLAASFAFTPLSGKSEVQTRIRMLKTQNLIAIAEMSDGSLWSASREVKVTIGGCGG